MWIFSLEISVFSGVWPQGVLAGRQLSKAREFYQSNKCSVKGHKIWYKFLIRTICLGKGRKECDSSENIWCFIWLSEANSTVGYNIDVNLEPVLTQVHRYVWSPFFCKRTQKNPIATARSNTGLAINAGCLNKQAVVILPWKKYNCVGNIWKAQTPKKTPIKS